MLNRYELILLKGYKIMAITRGSSVTPEEMQRCKSYSFECIPSDFHEELCVEGLGISTEAQSMGQEVKILTLSSFDK